MQAIIVADGDLAVDAAAGLRALLAEGERSIVVAADGGALKAAAAGLRPHVVVGDTDSLTDDQAASLRADGVELITHRVDKDQSDTELALREALARGATRIVLAGALGGLRFDHSLANLLLLTLPELAGKDVAIVDGSTTVRVVDGRRRDGESVPGTPGDYLSLLPLTERVEGVTTTGLAFPLADATLLQGPTLGLSNELTADVARVSVRSGRLAVIHVRREPTDGR